MKYKMSNNNYVDEYLYPFDSVDVDMLLKEHSLDLGSGWSISEEEYKKVVERNFQEHISEFFEKGLYAVETSIERTATSLEEGSQHQILSVQQQRERLSELLNKKGFGMNTSKENALLGALANRDELNTLLILEIPESCLGDLDNLASQAEQVNSKANNLDNLSSFGKLLSKDFGNTKDNSKLKVI